MTNHTEIFNEQKEIMLKIAQERPELESYLSARLEVMAVIDDQYQFASKGRLIPTQLRKEFMEKIQLLAEFYMDTEFMDLIENGAKDWVYDVIQNYIESDENMAEILVFGFTDDYTETDKQKFMDAYYGGDEKEANRLMKKYAPR